MKWPGDRRPMAPRAENGDDGVTQSVGAVHRAMLELLEALTDRPDRVCVRTDDVTIELDWRAPSPELVATAPRNGTQAHHVAQPAARPEPTPAHADTHAADTDESSRLRYICAPSVGTFYQAHEPGAAPFVTVGSTVTAGQQVGIVEVMKLMVPVEADVAGTVVEVLIDDCGSVEHGQRLVALAPVESA